MTSRITRLLLPSLVLLFSPGYSRPQSDQLYILIPADLRNRELRTIDNRILKVSDYPNKIIVITVFATWSEPCVKNVSYLNRLAAHDKNRVQVIGIAQVTTEPRIETVRTFARQLKIKYPIVWDDVDFSDSLADLVQVHAQGLPSIIVLPQTFVIDNSDRIRKHFDGFNLRKTPPLLRRAINEVRRERKAKTPRASS